MNTEAHGRVADTPTHRPTIASHNAAERSPIRRRGLSNTLSSRCSATSMEPCRWAWGMAR